MKTGRLESHLFRLRLSLLAAFIIICALFLVLRLAYLQFSQYQRYATLSLKNQMSILPIAPPRGIIYDKNGVILANNIPVYALEITPERVRDLNTTLKQLQALIPSITDEDIDNFNRARLQHRAFIPIPFKLKLSEEEVAIFASNQYLFPGVNIKARLMRYYPLGPVTAHVLGYVSRINIDELRQVNPTNYQGTDFIGKTGIEKYYEERLHGQVGYQQTETDVSGRTLRILSKQAPISGEKLYLTLDATLQQAAYEALGERRGAVVALDATSGKVLAMVSTPSFDPNLFVNGISNRDYQELSQSSARPLYNRAVRGLYPPASTVKPFVALAGLQKGAVTADTQVADPGWYRIPGISHKYRDWRKMGHGTVHLRRAIMVSCDTYFYQLGNRIGILALKNMLAQFGFGQLTNIDLHEEMPGILPSPVWKRANKGVSWYPGDTIITSIGQGFMLASPLQLANATLSLSQHGTRFTPHLLDKGIADQGKSHPYISKQRAPIQLSNVEFWNLVSEGMQWVITNLEGTGYRFGRDAPYTVAAKTGTAQVFSGSQYEKVRYEAIPVHLRDNSLFIAFAPAQQPEIAIAVVVENDAAASTVARKVLDRYFEQKALLPHETT